MLHKMQKGRIETTKQIVRKLRALRRIRSHVLPYKVYTGNPVGPLLNAVSKQHFIANDRV